MKKLIVTWLLITVLALTVSAFAEMNIVVTDFPCYDLAKQIAGGSEHITMLIKPGTEVHSFEPTPADILTIGGADLFVFVGGESDTWADGILEGLGDQTPDVLRLMESVQPIPEEGEEAEPEYDEHIWTSPKNALLMLRAVEQAMCEKDGANADTYHANADAYASQIEAIDAEIAALADGAVRKTLVFADRFPFLYFVKAYGFDYEAAFSSCTADTEPTPQVLMRLIDRVESESIPVIYTIELSTQKTAKTVAEATGAAIETLHSAQTVSQDEFDAGESYVSIMRRNIEALKKGLM